MKTTFSYEKLKKKELLKEYVLHIVMVTQYIILSPTTSRSALGPTKPPIKWVPRAFPPRVKWQGREADHPPPSSAQIKNGGTILHSPICLHGIVIN
jgi:hypothetical protein